MGLYNLYSATPYVSHITILKSPTSPSSLSFAELFPFLNLFVQVCFQLNLFLSVMSYDCVDENITQVETHFNQITAAIESLCDGSSDEDDINNNTNTKKQSPIKCDKRGLGTTISCLLDYIEDSSFQNGLFDDNFCFSIDLCMIVRVLIFIGGGIPNFGQGSLTSVQNTKEDSNNNNNTRNNNLPQTSFYQQQVSKKHQIIVNMLC